MHPEMYLSLHRQLERERDARLALRRRPAPTAPSADDGARLAPRLARAIATVRTAAAPSPCCAMA